jgi:hypothetical protein
MSTDSLICLFESKAAGEAGTENIYAKQQSEIGLGTRCAASFKRPTVENLIHQYANAPSVGLVSVDNFVQVFPAGKKRNSGSGFAARF